MEIRIHRGTKEVGGNCIEIICKNTRIIFDIGMPIVAVGSKDKARFDFSIYEKDKNESLVAKGVLPNIEGLYPWDDTGRKPNAIIISHPHIDHYGFLPFVSKDIPVYIGSAGNELIKLSNLFSKLKIVIVEFVPILPTVSFTIGDIVITGFLMCHSAFGAMAFMITGDDKSLIYSGDFRNHGRKKMALNNFLSSIPKDIDALMCEGTNINKSEDKFLSEDELEEKVVELLSSPKMISMAFLSSQNIDRIISFFKAAIRTDRILAVDVYTANALLIASRYGKIPHPSKQYPNIKVFFPPSICKIMVQCGMSEQMYQFKEFKITKEEMNKVRCLIFVKSSMLKIIDTLIGLNDSPFIYSLWEGYLEDDSVKRIINFVKGKGMIVSVVHSSGHADYKALKKMVDGVNPKVLIPIHSFAPEKFESFGKKIKLLEDGEKFEI